MDDAPVAVAQHLHFDVAAAARCSARDTRAHRRTPRPLRPTRAPWRRADPPADRRASCRARRRRRPPSPAAARRCRAPSATASSTDVDGAARHDRHLRRFGFGARAQLVAHGLDLRRRRADEDDAFASRTGSRAPRAPRGIRSRDGSRPHFVASAACTIVSTLR